MASYSLYLRRKYFTAITPGGKVMCYLKDSNQNIKILSPAKTQGAKKTWKRINTGKKNLKDEPVTLSHYFSPSIIDNISKAETQFSFSSIMTSA